MATFVEHRARIGTVLMAQPIIGTEDEEFTTSAFCDGNGGFYAHMTLKRKLSSDGFTDRAEVVQVDDIAGTVRGLCGLFRPIGPTNFQFRRHQGVLKLLEINPRVSSSTSIRTAFGYNECAMAVEYYLEGKTPQQPVIRLGRAVRYMEDLIFYS
jgi:carbamoyl-phosphate synthase large subunit